MESWPVHSDGPQFLTSVLAIHLLSTPVHVQWRPCPRLNLLQTKEQKQNKKHLSFGSSPSQKHLSTDEATLCLQGSIIHPAGAKVYDISESLQTWRCAGSPIRQSPRKRDYIPCSFGSLPLLTSCLNRFEHSAGRCSIIRVKSPGQ